MVVWALIWSVKTALWVPGACQEVKNLKLFKKPYSNVRPIRRGISHENRLLQFHKIYRQISVHWDLSIYCQNVHTMQCKIDTAIISEEKIWSISYFCCLEMPWSRIRSNFQRHGSVFSLKNSEIAWKTLNARRLKILICWSASGLYSRLN